MSIYKRGRFFYYDFWFEGVRYGPKSTKCTAKRDAEALVYDLKRQLLRGETAQTNTLTVGQALDLYWEAEASMKKAADCIQSYLKHIRRDIGEDTLWHQIDTLAVQRFANKQKAKGAAANSIRERVGRLRAIHRWLGKARPDVRRNANIEFPMPKQTSKIRVLSYEEQTALLDYLTSYGTPGGDETYDAVVFMLDTGARVGECVQSTWSMVRWGQNVIDLTRWKTIDSGVASSVIPLTSRLRQVLERRRAENKMSPYIFPTTSTMTDKPHRGTIFPILTLAYKDLGFNEPHLVRQYGAVTQHTLRHTFGTDLARQKVPVQVIQKLMGHSKIETTMTYVHMTEGDGFDDVLTALENRPN